MTTTGQLNLALSGRYTIERELGALTRVAVSAGTSFTVMDQRVLFSLRGVADWDVSPDGSRFITIREREGRPRSKLVVVENFFQELQTRVPR